MFIDYDFFFKFCLDVSIFILRCNFYLHVRQHKRLFFYRHNFNFKGFEKKHFKFDGDRKNTLYACVFELMYPPYPIYTNTHKQH